MFDTTVVIPTKDRPEMLLRAVLSISQQHLLPKRVVIIDDCSKVPVTAKLFSDITNLEITIINNNVSLGGASSRNIGIEQSDTKFVSFLDDDDAWDKLYLVEVSQVLENNSSDSIAVYTSKKFVLSTSLETVFKENIAEGIICSNELLIANSVGTTSCVTVPKQFLVDIDCFDKQLPALQDYDCWLRLAINSIVFHPVPSAFVYYTINVSAKQISGNYFNHINARTFILNKHESSLSNLHFKMLNGLLTFFAAKAIHRKNYFASLKYTFNAILLTKRLKAFALIVPYKVFVFFGVYTS